MTRGRRIRLVAATAAVAAACGGMMVASATTAPSPATGFTGGAPLPAAPSQALTRNQDGEPGMAAAPDGTFWIASDVAPYAADDSRSSNGGGVLSGTDVWKSTDGGQTYTWVADPFTSASSAPELGGEDTDLAVAPELNSTGHYNVYVTSLWVGSTSLAWSTDGGATWSDIALGGIPSEDRPWLAADGPCDVYVAYHQIPLFTPVINKYDVCDATGSGIGTTLNYTQSSGLSASTFPGLSNAFGKLVVDTSPTSPHRHNIYLPYEVCALSDATDVPTLVESAAACAKGVQLAVAVSTDGGSTYENYPVALSPYNETTVWPATVATDAAGTVYFAWTDNHNAFLNTSTDGGKTWSPPRQVNASPALAAVYPTVAAGPAGRVDVAFYGATRAGDSNDSKAMGTPGRTTSAPWQLYVAESIDGGATFTQSAATNDLVHRGVLCTSGSNCAADGSRNLLDDFGAAISPTTGLLGVTYTSDQPQGASGTAFTGFTTETAPLAVPAPTP